ncbi:MAG: CBS domain-containing protein [Desulfobulbaceae bacterium]|nr:CBS domain-containing protein [Desulfobulbaceae bacterium]
MEIKDIVKDFVISIDKYPHITENQTLGDAVAEILSFKWGTGDQYLRFPCLLVINDSHQMVGRVLIEDMLRGLEPQLFKKFKDNGFEGKKSDQSDLAFLWEETFFKNCKKKHEKPIKEFMSPIGNKAKMTDSILKVLYVMLQDKLSTIPVVDENKVVGILRLEEVFSVITGMCEL